jgi:hypothetical protein
MLSIDMSRQRYLDMIHRYLQGRLDYCTFRARLRFQWAQEHDALWQWAWQSTRAQRFLERDQLINGEAPLAPPSDLRRMPRMLDRLCRLCIEAHQEASFRASVQVLLTAYRDPEATSDEARYIYYAPRIPVFERPLPSGSNHRYLCTVEDIRAQLALVPEYDLEGLWAIGLSPLARKNSHAYGTYYRRKYPMGKPVILLHSVKGALSFMLRSHSDPGYIQQRYRVDCSYGMQIDRRGRSVICRWSAESACRFMVEHVLLHEIGHHVLYQQRWRAGLLRRLASPIHEQFAEDYALRFHRARQE